jgi:glycosyltransferase GT-like protein
MRYPVVLSEDATIEMANKGRSLTRYGDGELRLALTGTASAQRVRHPKLVKELRDILMKPQKALVCIPNAMQGPKVENWRKYTENKFVSMFRQPMYGSSFVTRPDSAPWINRPDYWQRVRDLWRNREVTLCIGTNKSLTPDIVVMDAKKVNTVRGPDVDAYRVIDELEEQIMAYDGIVVLCLGPTATVLAARLADKGRQALDLGHVGMFMKRLGALT